MKHSLSKLNKKHLIFIGLFVFAGISLLIYTRAAAPVANFEAENASTVGSQEYPDATASGGTFMQFGTGTTAPPQPAGRPTASNTGYKGTLRNHPGGTITTSMSDVNFTGPITITGNNVTIRNFKVNAGGGTYGIEPNGTNTVLEDGEIVNMASTGIYGSNFVARRLNIHESGNDGIKPLNNAVIEYSYIHHLGKQADSHADAVQARGSVGLLVRGNNCDIPHGGGYKGNSCVLMENGARDIKVEGNWLNSGNFVVKCETVSNIVVRNNRFGRDTQYKPIGGCPNSGGNVWDDTGLPI